MSNRIRSWFRENGIFLYLMAVAVASILLVDWLATVEIAAAWLLAAAMLGSLAGIGVTALCVASGRASADEERCDPDSCQRVLDALAEARRKGRPPAASIRRECRTCAIPCPNSLHECLCSWPDFAYWQPERAMTGEGWQPAQPRAEGE